MPDQEKLELFRKKLAHDGAPSEFIDTFAFYFQQLSDGEDGLIPESDIRPVEKVLETGELRESVRQAGRAAMAKTVMIKLNGGQGTSMGLRGAKSLLKVKGELSFLDIIAQQAVHDRIPLLLMNSQATECESLELLDRYDLVNPSRQRSFLQHREPKIRQDDLRPVSCPDNEILEWCPPGHGDLYAALAISGTLDRLLSAGYRYAFVSNVDNLGAVVDAEILGYMVQSECPFLMEVARRIEMDKKGGHLAQREDGQYILRDLAQCPRADLKSFQDIERHRYFNTNNLWIDLHALDDHMSGHGNFLGLPLIRNEKTVDPRDPGTTPVYHLETAMGSAISVFSGATAICVTRERFAPVKTTNELLLVRSNAYVKKGDSRIVPNPKRKHSHIVVELDPRYFKFIHDLDERFPFGPPSLVGCERLRIDGDFTFGRDVVIEGRVHLEPPALFVSHGRKIVGGR